MTIKFDVLNRFTGAVQFTAEIECYEGASVSVKLGLAVRWAVKARAYLADADLAGADLAGADLAGANLAGANLAGADLAGADLAGADLARANLADADLADADLADADLARADLAGAYLARAYLAGAYLAGAYLARAYLAGADLIDGGQRSDGYRFVGSVKDGALMISAGCRYLAIADARKHWTATRGGTTLGDETQIILDHIERVAVVRDLIAISKSETA